MRLSDGALDRLVVRAQQGDPAALDEVLRALRGPLRRFARGMGRRDDADDAAQEALLDVARGIATYRWQASFLSWAYAICARRVARRARADATRLETMADWLEASVTSGEPEELERHEQVLLAQHAHLACAIVVGTQLAPALRRAYLFGEVLGVDHQVGAQLCGCSPAAFRQRVSRARRLVAAEIRAALERPVADTADAGPLADELDRLVVLGDLRRARAHRPEAAGAERAAHVAAPTLMREA